MKTIIGLLILLPLFASCTSGVSDGVKSVALGKVIQGNSLELPHEPTQKEIEVYSALQEIIHVNIESTTEMENGKRMVHGEIKTDDANEIKGVIMTMAFRGNGEGETEAQAIKRAIASVKKEIDNSKGYKAEPLSTQFELQFQTKDGKEVVTSFKKIK